MNFIPHISHSVESLFDITNMLLYFTAFCFSQVFLYYLFHYILVF